MSAAIVEDGGVASFFSVAKRSEVFNKMADIPRTNRVESKSTTGLAEALDIAEERPPARGMDNAQASDGDIDEASVVVVVAVVLSSGVPAPVRP